MVVSGTMIFFTKEAGSLWIWDKKISIKYTMNLISNCHFSLSLRRQSHICFGCQVGKNTEEENQRYQTLGYKT